MKPIDIAFSVKPIILLILLYGVFVPVKAQDSLSRIAKTFIRAGDYSNAIVVLNRALQNEPNNLELKKDLAFTYYLQRDYNKSLEIALPMVEANDADVPSYQILGMIYKAIEGRKEAEKMYRTGLKKFPESGALRNEYGELLWNKKEFADASEQWQQGIKADPNYSGNYYNAAKYYFMSADKISGLLYGEIFVNLESYSKRTPEIKTLLLEGYKKLFADADLSKNRGGKNDFVKAVLEILNNQSTAIDGGISPDALSALRTRFILEWHEKYAAKFPFRLFDYHRQLASAGTFEAYNQWIFGAADDLSAFQQWTVTHSAEYLKFNTFQKNRVFKLPGGQDYFK